MLRNHILTALLALGMAAGCKAQPAPQTPQSMAQNRHIEVLIRSQFSVPQDIDLTLGERKPSVFPGYQSLPVTLSHGTKKTVIDFLLSNDGTTLARLETFSLAKDLSLSIDTANRPIRGNPQAKVTVINFDDLECPYCAQMHRTLFPATMERYKDSVRFIYKDNPLPPEMHPWAMRAAVDANCLASQSGQAYWSYVDYLHTHSQEVDGSDRNLAKSFEALDRIASQQGAQAKLDQGVLDACLAKQDETLVKASMKEAEKLGIEGAPAVFVDGERINGALPEPQVWKVIDRALRAAGIEPPDTASKPQPAASPVIPAPPAGAGN